MPRRFYVPQLGSGDTHDLTGSEVRHLVQVLRMGTGDRVVLFDGKGTEADAEITGISGGDTISSQVVLKILSRREATSELCCSLTIATAVPKGDRLKWMVEKLTELGVTRLVPLWTARSVVDPREGKLERLKQTVIEASKQCGRSSLMVIDPVVKWQDFLGSKFFRERVWIAHPHGMGAALREQEESTSPCTVVIGPEGGFTDEEIVQATERGGKLIRLGNRILRIETAAIAAAVLFGAGGEE